MCYETLTLNTTFMDDLTSISINLSSLSLFVATPEQVLESRRRTFLEWGKEMSTKEYLARDAQTDQDENARDEKFITWVLAPRDDPRTLNFASSIETYRREGLIWKQPSESDSGPKPPERMTCYGLASLFTPPHYRGRGYARHLMRLLHWVIADEILLSRTEFPVEWGSPPPKVQNAGNGRFSALWSDVGARYYDKCGPTIGGQGWVSRDSFSMIWSVIRDTPPIGESDDWVWLDEKHVMDLWDQDADQIARTLKPSRNHQVSFAFLPDKGVAAFQHRRMKLFTDKLIPAVQHWGIIAKSASGLEEDPNTFATWTYEVRPPGPKTLLITRLRCSPDNFERLSRMIFAAASKHGMQQVEVYNIPPELQPIAISLGGSAFEREKHVPAFKWYGEEDSSQAAWLLNERFCWC